MGTRADFYVGRGKQAEWIGSIAWDGYPEGIQPRSAEKDKYGISKTVAVPKSKHLFAAKTEAEFRERVAEFFANRDDVTLPKDGWPWPWETSHTTDYAYAFDGGKVYACPFGSYWFVAKRGDPEKRAKAKVEFPDMKEKQNVQLGGSKSGLMVIQG